MNGRVHRNSDSWKFTTTISRVVHYLICSGFFFKVRKTVLESNCLYFDTQMQMTSYLRCKMPFSNKN